MRMLLWGIVFLAVISNICDRGSEIKEKDAIIKKYELQINSQQQAKLKEKDAIIKKYELQINSQQQAKLREGE